MDFIPSSPSRFRYVSVFDDVALGFEITAVTSKLTIPQLPKEREDRLEFIYQLHLDGYSNKQISECLNSRGIKTPRGKTYSQKLIWVTLKKYKNRLERMDDTSHSHTEWSFYEKVKVPRIQLMGVEKPQGIQ